MNWDALVFSIVVAGIVMTLILLVRRVKRSRADRKKGPGRG